MNGLVIPKPESMDVKGILDKNGIDLWCTNEDGFTIYDLAGPTNKELLDSYCQQQSQYYTAKCHEYIRNNQITSVIDCTKHPICKYVDWNSLSLETGESMLHQAILNVNLDMTMVLFQYVDPAIRNKQGIPILELEMNQHVSKLVHQHLDPIQSKTQIKNLKRGYLQKGKGIRSKKRFFELNNDGILSCFKNDDCKHCHGILYLEELAIVIKSDLEFHLCTPYFRWKLTAQSKESAQEWIIALNLNSNVKTKSRDSLASNSTNSSIFNPSAIDDLDVRIFACRDKMKIELELLQEGLLNKPANELNLHIVKIKQQISVLDDLFVKKDQVVMKQVMPSNNALFDVHSLNEAEDDEFFDAISIGTQITISLPGYPVNPRQSFPVDHTLIKSNTNLLTLVKDLIGSDLLHVVLPVAFSEPSSILNRCCEMLEYSHLLDLAVNKQDPIEQLLLVTAFACSSYSSGIDRTNKPFDPIVGETFEIQGPNFIGICEQQCRIPSVTASYFESKYWSFNATTEVTTSFHGSHISITPVGYCILTLLINGTTQTYSWQPVKAACNGILTGRRWLDHYGTLTVNCHTTGKQSKIEFTAANWRRQHQYKLQGTCANQWIISGFWNDHFMCKRIDDAPNTFHLTEPTKETNTESGRSTVLWHCTSKLERKAANFNFTNFGISMNEITDELREYLPPTDVRLRPDLRAFENGDYVLADKLLREIENKHKKIEGSSKWFIKETHAVAGVDYYKTDGKYWDCRKRKDFKDCPRLFDLE